MHPFYLSDQHLLAQGHIPGKSLFEKKYAEGVAGEDERVDAQIEFEAVDEERVGVVVLRNDVGAVYVR